MNAPARGLWNIPQRFPRTTLGLVGLLTLVFSVCAARFRVDSAIDQLLPTHDTEGAFYEGVRQAFGSEEINVIGLFADDVYAPETLARIDRLSQGLARLPGVQEVTSLTTLQSVSIGDTGLSRERLMPPLPLSAEQTETFRNRVRADRMAERLIVSPDGHATGLWVRFQPMPDDEFLALGLEDRIRALIAATPGPEGVAITGLPTIKVQAARKMLQDLTLFVPLALLLVTGMVVWAFRTWRGVILPLATVVIGVVWTTGIMVLAGDAFTMGTLVLPPLLMAAGIAFAIHVVSRYYQELRDDRSNAEAVSAAVAHVRLPVAMAGLTTVIGFGTFVWSPIPSIRDFGIYAALGVAVIFSACMVVIPAALTLLPTPKSVPSGLEDGGWFADFVGACGELSIRHRHLMLAIFSVLLAIAGWGVTRVRFETDYLRFFAADNPVRVENARIGDALAGTQVMTFVVDGDGPESVTRVEVLAGMRELQRYLAAQDGVDKTLSLLDHLDAVREALQPGTAGAPFSGQREIDQLLLLLAPSDVRHELDKRHARAQLTAHTRLSGSREVVGFVKRVEAWGVAHMPPGVRVHGTGTVVLMNRSADALAWSQVTGDGQVMLILLALMSLLFRSFKLGALSMVPNVFPIVMLLGAMGWVGIDLNICTSTIASISIGIAVDDTIHYMLGYYGELQHGATRQEAILATLRSVGRPILIISVALSTGFLIACLSNFEPVRHFGVLASLTMVVGSFTDLFLLPALLITLRVGDELPRAAALAEPTGLASRVALADVAATAPQPIDARPMP
ncbi:MAG: MMPL family transporter [bacterium]